jgi:hypothetical protein
VTQTPGHGGTARTAEAELPAADPAAEPSATAEEAATGKPSVTATAAAAAEQSAAAERLAAAEPSDSATAAAAAEQSAAAERLAAAVPDLASSAAPRAGRDPVTTARADLPDPGRTSSPPARRKFAWLGRRWVAVIVFVVAGIGLFFAYLLQARTMAIHLDAASASGPQTLQAWDMLHGNPLLRGWQLADVSFYTTELPEYVAVEAVRGLSGDVVHVAAALTYTLMVLLAGLLAKGRAKGREGLVRLLVAVGIMLAPTLVAGTSVMLSGPDHTGTQVPLLLIWLVLDRARPRWWVPAVIALLLTWAMVADLLVLYEGVLPLVVVCAVRMYRHRGRPRAWLRAHWYELSLVAAAMVSIVAAERIIKLIRDAGGFSVRTPLAGFTTVGELAAQFWVKVENLLAIFGAGFFSQPFGAVALIALLHLVGVSLVVWAVAVGAKRLFRDGELIVQVLTTAFLVLLAAYLFGTKPDPNEMIGLLPIGAVLAGRLLAGRLISGGLVPAMSAVLVTLAIVLGTNAAQPAQAGDTQPAVVWLAAHHLTYGLGQFGVANSATVYSGNQVQIRPVRLFHGEVVTTPWEMDSSWYSPRLHFANFVIWKPNNASCGVTCPTLGSLRGVFGPPSATYKVGAYYVLVWRHQNLLTSVQTLTWCGNVWPWNANGTPSLTACQ